MEKALHNSAFCTIITPDYRPFAECLLGSIRKFYPEAVLHVLVTGESIPQQTEGLIYYRERDLDAPAAEQIRKKYEGHRDAHRWSMKPLFLLHLLGKVEKILYTDCDIHFFGSPDFLFNLLNHHSFLLTPHLGSPDPFVHEEKFRMNFLAGLFNAGFVGVNSNADAALEWWATACLYRNEVRTEEGFYVDQRYLDMIPVLDPHAFVVQHRGCNAGSWNIESCKRELQEDGSVRIGGDQLIFLHFTYETIRQIRNGNDGMLRPYLEKYESAFQQTGASLENFIPRLKEWQTAGTLSSVKRKLSVRTRIKSFLFQLARKI